MAFSTRLFLGNKERFIVMYTPVSNLAIGIHPPPIPSLGEVHPVCASFTIPTLKPNLVPIIYVAHGFELGLR
jgi:hypothetical protein